MALQDRGHTLAFEPTAEEVHRKTGEWFDQDTDIYEWFSENLHLVREPSMRLYLRASELKRAGMDWMDIVPLAPEDQRQRLVAELQADTSYGTEESRAQEFIARGGGCRATYFNHSRRLKAKGVKGNTGTKRRISVPAAVSAAS